MIYLSGFSFPSRDQAWCFIMDEKHTCYDSFYPFGVLDGETMELEPVTVLYGGNGCGKTTALNVIAVALGLKRDALYNRSSFFEDYTGLCDQRLARAIPEGSRIITSDDVLDYMLNLRSVNQGIDQKRETLFREYLDNKYSKFKFNALDDYERLKQVNLSRRTSQSKYVRESLMDNIRERSNGESAFQYFLEQITEPGLYLLDEPENSLSPERQMELCQFLSDASRFNQCQFVISTHSPFLLAMKDARIYDLDQRPIARKPWTELKNVRTYFDFFESHRNEFK